MRPVPCKKNNVFELASRKGAKRLWMCRSEEDRAAWLQAIAAATLPAGLLGPEGLDGVGPYAPFLHDMRRYRDARAALAAAEDRGAYRRAVAALLLAAAPAEAEAAAEEEQEEGGLELRVPFAWVRAQTTAAADAGEGAGGLGSAHGSPHRPEHLARSGTSHHTPTSHRRPRGDGHGNGSGKHAGVGGGAAPPSNPQGELAQLWKDMARDKVCINGRVFYGDGDSGINARSRAGGAGPEAILGALARTILELAARARELEAMAAAAARAGSSSTSSPSSPGHAPAQQPQQQQQPQQPPAPLLSGLTEVQVVAHTLEILLACNRTQSGGDTYACVEYLFRNQGLVVVCPYSTHAEPLQISLELLWDGEASLAAEHHPHHYQQPPSLPKHQHHQPPPSTGTGSRPSSINYSRASTTATTAAALTTAATAPPGASGGAKAPPAHQISSLSRSDSFSSKATAGSSSWASTAGSSSAGPRPSAATTSDSPPRPISASASIALPFDPSSAAAAMASAGSAPTGPTALFARPLPWSAPAAPQQSHPPTHTGGGGGGSHHHPYHTFESALGSTTGGGNDAASLILSRTAATAPPFLEDAGEAPRHRRPPTPVMGSGGGGGNGHHGGAPPSSSSMPPRPVILVRVQANTAYKVCPLDPQGDEGADTWATVAARFEQRFTVSGSGLAKSQELIRLRTVLARDHRGDHGGGGEVEVEVEVAPAPSSWASTASSVAALGAALEKQQLGMPSSPGMGPPDLEEGGGGEPPAEAAT